MDYRKRADGFYQYEYFVAAPEENKGIISGLDLDISCYKTIEYSGELPIPQGKEGYIGIFADGEYVPSAVNAEWGSASVFGIGISREASWGLYQKPGQERDGLTIVAPTKPGLRQYQLTPAMDNNPDEWDYASYGEHDPRLPWIEDFTVTGMIAGPACPGVTPPLEEEEVFLGNRPGREDEAANRLLSYTRPLKNRLHVDGKKTFAMTVRYGEGIDPKSFHAQPGWLKRYFNPQPGTEERVVIPLKRHRTRIQLEVHPEKETGPEAEPHKGNAEHHSRKDRDVFEVRHDGIEPEREDFRGRAPDSAGPSDSSR